jgi:hypothetical protein
MLLNALLNTHGKTHFNPRIAWATSERGWPRAYPRKGLPLG